jgi:hypothetical protein
MYSPPMKKPVPKLLMTSFISLLARPIATVASLTALNLSASIIKQNTVTQFNNLIVQSLCFDHDFEDFCSH